jgi:hypothetical protein
MKLIELSRIDATRTRAVGRATPWLRSAAVETVIIAGYSQIKPYSFVSDSDPHNRETHTVTEWRVAAGAHEADVQAGAGHSVDGQQTAKHGEPTSRGDVK